MTDGDGQAPSGAFDRLREAIKNADRLDKDAARTREQAEDLRKRAQELLDDLSPEQREELDQLARELAERRGPAATPPAPQDLAARQTESVDARPSELPPEARERVIAEWYGDEDAPRDAKSRSQIISENLRGAAEGAQQAVEQQRIPPRYRDLIRRVYRQIEERSGGVSDGSR